MKDSRAILGTDNADQNQIFVRHVIDKVNMVPSVRYELVMVLAESEVTQPLFD